MASNTTITTFYVYAYQQVSEALFLGCLSVTASFGVCVWMSVLSARYLTNQRTEFQQTLVIMLLRVQMNCI